MKILRILLICLCLCGLGLGVMPDAWAAPASPKKNVADKKNTTKKSSRQAGTKKKTTKKTQRTTQSTRNPRAAQVSAAAAAATAAAMPGGIVPISVRGNADLFSRPVLAYLYNNAVWLLPHQSEEEAAAVLSAFAPSSVIGAARFDPGNLPDDVMVESWHYLRETLQKSNAWISMDIVIDLARYATAAEAVKHMQDLDALLTAEAWTFAGTQHASPEVVQAAVEQARQTGKSAGALAVGPPSVRMDYLLLPLQPDAAAFPKEAARLSKNTAKLTGTAPVVIGVVTETFVKGIIPSKRRLMVMSMAADQGQNVRFAYPVFGPQANGTASYDATRDEFMLDTLRRTVSKHNPAAVRGLGTFPF